MSHRRTPRRFALGRRVTSEDGFTLVEVMAALGIVLVALMGLAYTATIGFSDVALARQRQGANSLANEAMEQVRALPFDTMKRGLANDDLDGDPNITECGSPPGPCYGGEWLVRGANPEVVPLVPHRQPVTVGPTTYTVASYVTYYESTLTTDTYRVTIVVTWPDPARGGVRAEVQTQSIFFSGTGCTSTATHPFAGPCQPFLYGNASVDSGHVDITGTFAGVGLEHANLWLPAVASNMQIEQVSAIQGTAEVGGLTLKVTGADEQTAGRDRVASKADNDPGQEGATYDTEEIPPPPQVGGTLQASRLGSTLTLSAGAGGDAAGTTSTTSALTTTYPCPDRNGISRNDALACGNSNARVAPELAATLRLVNGALDLGAAALVTMEPPSDSGPHRVAFTNRDVQHEAGEPATECPVTSGEGCVHSDAYRSTGEITLGDVPSALRVLAPLGWNGYLVRITPGTASVSAEVGTGASPPAASSTGDISYWNGTGYSTIPMLPSGTPTQIVAGPVTVGGGLILPGVSVVLSATVTQGTVTLDDPAGCLTPCTRTRASASSGSPIIDLTYRVTVATATVADLNVHLDLGAALVQDSYQPAPGDA